MLKSLLLVWKVLSIHFTVSTNSDYAYSKNRSFLFCSKGNMFGVIHDVLYDPL